MIVAITAAAPVAAKASGLSHVYGYAVLAIVGFLAYKLVSKYRGAVRANLISQARAEGKAEAVAEARASASQSVAVMVGDNIGGGRGDDDGPYYLHRDGESLRLVRFSDAELRDSGPGNGGGVRSLPVGIRDNPTAPGSANGALPTGVRSVRPARSKRGGGVS